MKTFAALPERPSSPSVHKQKLFSRSSSFVRRLSFGFISFHLSAGKKGYQAFQRMDQLYAEMQEEAYQNQETEITIL